MTQELRLPAPCPPNLRAAVTAQRLRPPMALQKPPKIPEKSTDLHYQNNLGGQGSTDKMPASPIAVVVRTPSSGEFCCSLQVYSAHRWDASCKHSALLSQARPFLNRVSASRLDRSRQLSEALSFRNKAFQTKAHNAEAQREQRSVLWKDVV